MGDLSGGPSRFSHRAAIPLVLSALEVTHWLPSTWSLLVPGSSSEDLNWFGAVLWGHQSG